MQRHEALAGLSEEHHHGLVWSRRLRKLTSRDTEQSLREVIDQFLQVWEQEINPHFRREEEILLPVFARTDMYWAESIREMLRQHVLLRRDVWLIKEDPQPHIIQRIGDLLQEHIRLEEREVFPLIQQHAEEHLLARIGELLHT